MRFKIDLDGDADEDGEGLVCENCESKLEKIGAKFIKEKEMIVCPECEKQYGKQTKIQVCLVKGSDLERYA